MIRLFFADIKMLVRNRQALFWSLMFPLMFTVIFGFFFGNEKTNVGQVILISHSDSQLAQSLVDVLKKSEVFTIVEEQDFTAAKEKVEINKASGIIEIPETFGDFSPQSAKQVKVVYNPANATTNTVILNFIHSYLTQVNFQVQEAQPIYSVLEEKTNARQLNYFDFVLIGLIGMALMNSSIQGVSIQMAKYREDKILKRLTTTPLKPGKFILAEVFSRLIINAVQISLILALGVFAFGAHIYGNIGLIYLLSLLGAILFQSIGFTVSSLSKTTQAAEGMSVAITIPMMFLAGVFFPIDQLPNWLVGIVKYLPLAPLLQMLREVSLEVVSPLRDPSNLIIVLVWIGAMLAVASFRFRLSDE